MEHIILASDYSDMIGRVNAANQQRMEMLSMWYIVFIILFVVAIIAFIVGVFLKLKESKNTRVAETKKAEAVTNAESLKAVAAFMKAQAEVKAFDERSKDDFQNNVIRSMVTMLSPDQRTELVSQMRSTAQQNGEKALQEYNAEMASLQDEDLDGLVAQLASEVFNDNGTIKEDAF